MILNGPENGPGEGMAAGRADLRDGFGRRIEYARLSLTDRCNFRCIYCMPHDGLPFIPHERIMSYEEMLRLCGIMTSLGITTFKVTGGEPLCRRGAAGFIRDLAALPDVTEVTLTTNGSLLAPHLEFLAESGLRSVTFSCDAMDQTAFAAIARTDASLDAVKASMENAAALGLRIKINTVPLMGYNDGQLVALARFALERGYHIRFIELMPVGRGRTLSGVPQEELFAAIEREFGGLERVYERTGNGPATVYQVSGYPGRVGFIAALSERFCTSCNRVRLTSTGFLKTCLCHEAGVDLREPARSGARDEELRATIRRAVAEKPAGHSFSFAATGGKEFFMNSVGG
ncbi:Cyclic pyranopterin monophosphate synthase [uncultured delta proteobacterium]|uniref:GTP 3',8-cyclase n=1 Tax=uncultured delta proteobacterium TaxID=34034 RepID=A0A212JAV7_9DELT|nr:Cyclic pyranopterin monophosphate synthase [uncultured delta proteobacterium]